MGGKVWHQIIRGVLGREKVIVIAKDSVEAFWFEMKKSKEILVAAKKAVLGRHVHEIENGQVNR